MTSNGCDCSEVRSSRWSGNRKWEEGLLLGPEPRGGKPGLYGFHGALSTQKFHLAPLPLCPWVWRAHTPGWVSQVGLSLAIPPGLTVQPGAEEEPSSSSPQSKPGSLAASKPCRYSEEQWRLLVKARCAAIPYPSPCSDDCGQGRLYCYLASVMARTPWGLEGWLGEQPWEPTCCRSLSCCRTEQSRRPHLLRVAPRADVRSASHYGGRSA